LLGRNYKEISSSNVMFNDYYNRTEGHLEILRSELLGDEGVTGCEKRNTINLSVQLKLTR